MALLDGSMEALRRKNAPSARTGSQLQCGGIFKKAGRAPSAEGARPQAGTGAGAPLPAAGKTYGGRGRRAKTLGGVAGGDL